MNFLLYYIPSFIETHLAQSVLIAYKVLGFLKGTDISSK